MQRSGHPGTTMAESQGILDTIAQQCAASGLGISGAFNPGPGDGTPAETGTLVLISPAEPGFWAHVTQQPEFRDGRPDPLDRWSQRVIEAIALHHQGAALFPFTGPPFLPFWSWALRSERAWASPVRLLVHEAAGLFISYRGALALPQRLALPPPQAQPPCATCDDKPCLSACPVAALGDQGYDLTLCHGFLDQRAGADCMNRGCAVRRACPVSARHGRLPEQSAWHMRRFHPT